jgi:hypothetical protein
LPLPSGHNRTAKRTASRGTPDTIPRFKIKGCGPNYLGQYAGQFAKNDNAQVFAQPDAFLVVLLRFGDGEFGV